MERLVILTDGDYISADLVAESLIISPIEPHPFTSQEPPPEPLNPPEHQTKASLDKKAILSALAAAQGNKKKAAQILGISRTTLWRRLKKYNI
jgi:DNA-binding NtrC family response regulator